MIGGGGGMVGQKFVREVCWGIFPGGEDEEDSFPILQMGKIPEWVYSLSHFLILMKFK